MAQIFFKNFQRVQTLYQNWFLHPRIIVNIVSEKELCICFDRCKNLCYANCAKFSLKRTRCCVLKFSLWIRDSSQDFSKPMQMFNCLPQRGYVKIFSKSWNFSTLIVKWNRGMLKAFGHKTNMGFGFFLFPPWKYLNCNPRLLAIPFFLEVWNKMWEVQDPCISMLVQKDIQQEWRVSRILNRRMDHFNWKPKFFGELQNGNRFPSSSYKLRSRFIYRLFKMVWSDLLPRGIWNYKGMSMNCY